MSADELQNRGWDEQPPGTVAVSADEAGRFTQFAMSMQGLEMPSGSRTVWQVGNDIAGNRNRAAGDIHGDWLWFIDDDHAFAPSILTRLLAHDVDIVAPLCLRRQQPFDPVSFTSRERIEVLDLSTAMPAGLVEVEAAGSAGMLIRRHVFERLEEPYFRQTDVSEDIVFCDKARAAGFDIYVDLATRLGHITTAVVWPAYVDGEWRTGLTVADGLQVHIESAAKANQVAAVEEQAETERRQALERKFLAEREQEEQGLPE